ncbi:hypothetical protein BDW59DRAFT_146636 [Aspergillus cavernicola]|uniref:RING-type domain-containing protein n=1 Tax=Aspergillus cavernicola TaxID=176166 RepID=A0ABR4IBV3_9EURO
MAAAAQPLGLMDIASSLAQEDIPFKLRCAICNTLAVNAFRLPCCDQAICENCQTSLPDTCPVCAHTPISSDLCKPNKALRTTLKAFLRTEEKKREKERQAGIAVVTDDATPTEATSVKPAPLEETHTAEATPANGIALPNATEVPSEPQPTVILTPTPAEASAPAVEQDGTNEIAQDEQPENGPPETADDGHNADQAEPIKGDGAAESEAAQQTEQETSQSAQPGVGFPNSMGMNMNPGMFPNMPWGANPMMAQFMGNGMMGFPNPMGMPGMGMDPMAANQGMFGGYGMNMNGMSNGMNMGMNFNAGQGMYGWDGSQNNMWNGSQVKFNPNAFANGMGAQFGDPSGFGGYNMSQPNGVSPQMQQQQFPNQEFQTGYHGPGNYRGRGRGHYAGGRGRGGFAGHMQPNLPHNANSAPLQDDNSASMNPDMPSQSEEGAPRDPTSTTDDQTMNDGKNTTNGQDSNHDPASKESNDKPEGDSLESMPPTEGPSDQATAEDQQLHGIPTIDGLDQANSAHGVPTGPMGIPGHMNQGFGRGGGGYIRGGFHGGHGGGFGGQQFMPGINIPPRGPGVEGAPAAPRAMRQGLPNTSVFRHRNFQGPGRGSMPPGRSTEASETPHTDPAQEDQQTQSASRSVSRAESRPNSRSRSRSRSPTQSRSNSRRRHRQQSLSANNKAEDPDRQRDRHRRPHLEKERPTAEDDERRTRSPSIDSHRSSRHRDKGRDHRSVRSRRSRRSRRQRSRSRSGSPNRKSEVREDDRLSSIREESIGSRSRNRNLDTLEGSSHTHRSGKDRSSRREEDRERDKDSRRRDRDRDRGRHRESERDKEKERERHRDRDGDRERDRKRSRRDRSEAAAADGDYNPKKPKRAREDVRATTSNSNSNRDCARESREKPPSSSSKPPEPEKDPHTLEREARNRERLLKERQRREAMQADRDRDGGKPSRRRDSRQERERDRAGRRLNYKYDDETNSARAAKVEREREASRWG